VFEHDEEGRAAKYVATPFQLDATSASVRRPPPKLGEHTLEILGEAGYSPAEVEALRASGAIGKGL
jgi:alpha-methylacyl-CoA racemase